jgi:hypothetical protein
MEAELFHTDRHDEADSRFSQFCERVYNCNRRPSFDRGNKLPEVTRQLVTVASKYMHQDMHKQCTLAVDPKSDTTTCSEAVWTTSDWDSLFGISDFQALIPLPAPTESCDSMGQGYSSFFYGKGTQSLWAGSRAVRVDTTKSGIPCRLYYGDSKKQSHYRPGQTLKVPGGRGSQMSRQSAYEGGKVVKPTHRPPLSQEIFLVLISVRG